jgi:hypothetical protein
MINAAFIANALQKSKQNGSDWMACCPAHDDHNPSLSISDGEDGKVLVKCFAGCTQSNVIDALKAKRLWPEQSKNKLNGKHSAPQKTQKKRIVKTYDYCDPRGNVVHQGVRLEPKSFFQRRPDGNGGYINSIKGVTQVPYRLPDFIKKDYVLIVEGEKDVDQLWDIGMPATTNSGGANKWPSELSQYFKDKNVFIIPDNDDSGRKHAELVASNLIDIAASVKVCAVCEDMPERADISDWLDAGKDRDTLHQLLDTSPIWEPRISVEAHESESKLITATQYEFVDPASIPCRDWVCKPHLIRKYTSLTVAPGGVGKSSLLIVEALALASGKNLLGMEIERPYRVWLWNGEDPREELIRRIQAAGIKYEISADDIGDLLFIDTGREQDLCTAVMKREGAEIVRPVVERVVEQMIHNKIDVLIVDPFVSSHQVIENDNPAMDLVAKEWGRVADRTNAAIELVHHTRKQGPGIEVSAESARGGKALIDAARDVRVLNRMTKEQAEQSDCDNHRSYFSVISDKSNLAPPPDKADWYRLENIELGNGDHVGVVVPWKWPDPFENITTKDLIAVQYAVDGKELRQNVQANDWVGHTIAEVLGLDSQSKRDKNTIKALLKTWIDKGALTVAKGCDGKARSRPIIEVGQWADQQISQNLSPPSKVE